MNCHSTVRKDSACSASGPVGSFAARYAEVTGAPVGVVVNARGGSSIDEWLPGSETDYLAKSRRTHSRRRRLGRLRGRCSGIRAKPTRRIPNVTRPNSAASSAILRTELGNPSLPVVFGEIAHWNWTNRAEGTAPFNAMLRSLRIPHTACVSAEGLAPMKDETDPHFSAASQRELGRRYAEALLKIR